MLAITNRTLALDSVNNYSAWWENDNSTDLSEDPENEEGEYVPYNQRPETYIVPILFALIFVVGVLGNGTLVLIFIRHRTMRNVPNTYIFSLALGDLLVITTCVPFTSTVYTVDSWPYGKLICKLSECVKDISIGVSVFTLTALSAERYCAIVNPIRRHVMSAKPLTLVVAIGIWILALSLAMPSALFSYVQDIDLGNNHSIKVCTPFPEEYGKIYVQMNVLFKFLIYYVIPLVVIAFFYILMALNLELSTRNMPGESQGQSSQIRARKKVAKMVLAFVIIFIFCFFPYHTFMLWFHFYPYSKDVFDEMWHAYRIVGFCLSFINSCINPIALYCVSGTFRKYFNHYLFCCCDKQGLKRRTNTMCESSTHTVVHFNSTFRKRPNGDSYTGQTSVFNLDKT